MIGGYQIGAYHPAYQHEALVSSDSSGGFWTWAERHRIERQRKRRREREIEQETQDIADAQAREIARLLRVQEEKDAERAELARLQKLADQYSGKALGLPRQVSAALINAYEARSRNALEQLRREVERMLEEEEMALVMLLLNDE